MPTLSPMSCHRARPSHSVGILASLALALSLPAQTAPLPANWDTVFTAPGMHTRAFKASGEMALVFRRGEYLLTRNGKDWEPITRPNPGEVIALGLRTMQNSWQWSGDGHTWSDLLSFVRADLKPNETLNNAIAVLGPFWAYDTKDSNGAVILADPLASFHRRIPSPLRNANGKRVANAGWWAWGDRCGWIRWQDSLVVRSRDTGRTWDTLSRSGDQLENVVASGDWIVIQRSRPNGFPNPPIRTLSVWHGDRPAAIGDSASPTDKGFLSHQPELSLVPVEGMHGLLWFTYVDRSGQQVVRGWESGRWLPFLSDASFFDYATVGQVQGALISKEWKTGDIWITTDSGRTVRQVTSDTLRGGWIDPIGTYVSPTTGRRSFIVLEEGGTIHTSPDLVSWTAEKADPNRGEAVQKAPGRILQFRSGYGTHVWTPQGWATTILNTDGIWGSWDQTLTRSYTNPNGTTTLYWIWSDSAAAWTKLFSLETAGKGGILKPFGSGWIRTSDSSWLVSRDGSTQRCILPRPPFLVAPSRAGDILWTIGDSVRSSTDSGATWRTHAEPYRAQMGAAPLIVSRDTFVFTVTSGSPFVQDNQLEYTFDGGRTWGLEKAPDIVESLIPMPDGSFLAGGIRAVWRVRLTVDPTGTSPSRNHPRPRLVRAHRAGISLAFAAPLAAPASWEILGLDGRILATGGIAAGANFADLPASGHGLRIVRMRGGIVGSWRVIAP